MCAMTQTTAPQDTMSDLKLLALDDEDLGNVSAHVQDAVVKVGDMG